MATDYKGVSSIMPFVFGENDSTGYKLVGTSQQDLVGFNGQDTWGTTWGIAVPFDGSIVGIAYAHETADASYTTTASLNINGVLKTGVTATAALSALKAYSTYQPGEYTVNAGDEIAVEMTSNSDSAAAAGNVVVVIYIQVGSSAT